MRVIKRFFQSPEQSFFLFGPRGTGKSTLMQTLYSDAILVDLLNPAVHRSYLARPERLYEVVNASAQGAVIIIDEVQRAPDLLSVVHGLIEEKRGFKFILTGSSARKLKRAGSDLLGGRALKCTLHPFMAAELGVKFSLSRALQYGLLPLVLNAPDPQKMLHAYVSLYLHEEIQAEGLVRSLENFSRFLEVISFSHASQLNVTNIARECEVKRKTVENYIGVLEDLLLAYQLPLFTKRAQRELSTHSKFYLFDAGVFSALRPQGPLDKPTEIEGAAFEGLIGQHLRAWCEYSSGKYTLYFWRTRSGVEVDFIVYGSNCFWAIEVKNATRVHTQDIKSLGTFLQDYPSAKALLLYRGKEYLQIGQVLCVPCEDFLQQLQPDQLLWQEVVDKK